MSTHVDRSLTKLNYAVKVELVDCEHGCDGRWHHHEGRGGCHGTCASGSEPLRLRGRRWKCCVAFDGQNSRFTAACATVTPAGDYDSTTAALAVGLLT